MKLASHQLAQHLGKQLSPVYLVCGDEPLQHQEACDAIRQKARELGFNQRQYLTVDGKFQWQDFVEATQTLSLFSSKQIIELRVTAKLGQAGSKALQHYAESYSEDLCLLITMDKLDSAQQKAKWFKALDKIGTYVPIWPIDRAQLPNWIQQRGKTLQLAIPLDAATLLADHVEGNLLAAAQELEKIHILQGNAPIDCEQLTQLISNNARYNIFSLTDSILTGEVSRLQRILQHLQADGTEAILVLWALAKECRTLARISAAKARGESLNSLFQQHQVWMKRQGIVTMALKRHSQNTWQQCLRLSHEIDLKIKGFKPGNPWLALSDLAMKMAS